MKENTYEPPVIRPMGSVHEMTQQELDKVGHSADIATKLLPNLTGKIVPDA